MVEFQDLFLDFVDDVWIHGHFTPKPLNQGKKSKNTTNNDNEG